MEIRFKTQGNKDVLEIDDAILRFKNFSGKPSAYNAAGDRNFSILIEDEALANELIERGWNVKIKPPKEDGDIPFMHLKVKVNFNEWGPKVYLKTGNKRNILNEDTVGVLDMAYITKCDLDVRAYDWNRPDGSGRTAYLQLMHVEQEEMDRFAARYAEEEAPEECF